MYLFLSQYIIYFLSYYLCLGVYDARWRVLVLYVTQVFELDLSVVDVIELSIVNRLSNFSPVQTELVKVLTILLWNAIPFCVLMS